MISSPTARAPQPPARERSRADALVPALALGSLFVFLAWFYLMAPANDPGAVFFPYQFAVVACGVLAGHAATRKKWLLAGVAVAVFLFLLLVGTLEFPVSIAACQDWIASGRLRNWAM